MGGIVINIWENQIFWGHLVFGSQKGAKNTIFVQGPPPYGRVKIHFLWLTQESLIHFELSYKFDSKNMCNTFATFFSQILLRDTVFVVGENILMPF